MKLFVNRLFVYLFLLCLLRVRAYVVPNIVHQTYDYQRPSYFMFLSLKCVQFYLKPDKHILWVNDEGRFRKGHWDHWQISAKKGSWEAELVSMLHSGSIESKFITFPSHPPGNESIHVSNKAHRSDFLRFKILQDQGGIYIDTDAFPLKSMDDLRSHNFTIAFDNVVNPDKRAPDRLRLNNGVMLATRHARFLKIWEQTYWNFDPSVFGHHSSVVPFDLAIAYPDLVHIEWNRLSPLSFGLQTTEAAAALTCGLFLPEYGAIWYPSAYSKQSRKHVFPVEADTLLYQSFQTKFVLHLTMSGVRGVAMLRQNLGPDDLTTLPSFLGHIFRRATSPSGNDAYNYKPLYELYRNHEAESKQVQALELWDQCRLMLGMHTPLERLASPREVEKDPSKRQQYVTSHLPS